MPSMSISSGAPVLVFTMLIVGCLTAADDSRENAMRIVRAEVTSYCISLEENATETGGYCGTCYAGSSPDTFNQSIEEMTVTDLGDAYLIEVRVGTIYNWRNDLPGSRNLTFVVSKNGTLISRNIPPNECV